MDSKLAEFGFSIVADSVCQLIRFGFLATEKEKKEEDLVEVGFSTTDKEVCEFLKEIVSTYNFLDQKNCSFDSIQKATREIAAYWQDRYRYY